MKNTHKWLIGLLLIIIIAVPVVAIDSWVKIDDKTYAEKEGERVTYWFRGGTKDIKQLENRLKDLEMKQRGLEKQKADICESLTREELLEYCYESQVEQVDYTDEIESLKHDIAKLKKVNAK